MPGRLLAVLGRFDRAGRIVETTLLVVVLGSLMTLAVGQIVLREVFTFSFRWASELQKLMVLWLAMIATIAACRDNRHIRIDALSRVLPAVLVRVSRVLVDLFAAAVCSVIAWHLYRWIRIEFEDEVLVRGFGNMPAWIAHSIMPIAFLLTGYRFVVNAVKKAAGLDDSDNQDAVP